MTVKRKISLFIFLLKVSFRKKAAFLDCER